MLKLCCYLVIIIIIITSIVLLVNCIVLFFIYCACVGLYVNRLLYLLYMYKCCCDETISPFPYKVTLHY